jgi:aspartate aminotransferase/aminotransferase
MPEFRFARRVRQIEMSGIRRMFELARTLRDPVDLSLGQPHFDAPEAVKAAAQRAIAEGRNRYTETRGISELREALAAHIERVHGVRPEALMITSGAAGAIFLALMCLVDEGDEVLVPDPYFVLYRQLVVACGGTPVLVDTYPDFRLTPARLDAVRCSRPRLLIVNSPNNPTGVVLSREELAAIAAWAREREVAIVSDEIYDAFVYDGVHEGMARHYSGTVVAGAFSKAYGVPGWRVGYAYGPAPVIEQMAKFQQFSFVCANSVAQYAALEALRTDVRPYVEDCRRRRDRICEALAGVYEFVRPQGAFYLFPRVPWGTDEEFVAAARAEELLIVPGRAASARGTHFRISYAVPDRVLERGIEILRRLARR